LWVGGCDWGDNPAGPLAVLETGISVAFDRVDAAISHADGGSQGRGYAGLIAGLIRSGYAEQIVLGSGIDRR
jgi:hypothetical protein